MHDIAPMIMSLGFFSMIAFIVYQVQQHRLRAKMIEKGVTQLDLPKAPTRSDQSCRDKYSRTRIFLPAAQ